MDNYQILNIKRGATQEEIKTAFRKLAHVHHPDKPTGNAEKFKQINNAYQELIKEKPSPLFNKYHESAYKQYTNPFTDPDVQWRMNQQRIRKNQEEMRKQADEIFRKVVHLQILQLLEKLPSLQKEFRNGKWWYTF